MHFSSPNAMGPMTPQKQNMMFSSSPTSLASPEQQPQPPPQGPSLFHPQNSMAPMNRDQQPMQFQSQSSGSGQAEPPQAPPTLFRSSPQIQLVQGSPGSQEQPVTLFISSASMSALQNSMSQPEMAQPSLYSSQNSMSGLPGASPPPQQQAPQPAAMFHNTAGGGPISQLQNASASSRQTSGIFLFGIQDSKLKAAKPRLRCRS